MPVAAPTPPYQSDQTYDPGRWASWGWDKLKGIGSSIGNALSPTQPDLNTGYGGNIYDPAIGRSNIGDLFSASRGMTPSAAEVQLQGQAGKNEASQFALASALQGRNPGLALQSARMGALQTQNQTNIDAAMLRAKEQADARNQLAQALANERQQDLGYQQALLQARVGSAAAQNQYKGSLLGGAGSILGSVFSDRRLKTDVKPANLTKLAESIKGFRFKYKDPQHGEGERVGVMAQDVARGGPVGRRIVARDGAGRMKLDIGNAVGAALAMSAEALRKAS